jgi:hypothetical protein
MMHCVEVSRAKNGMPKPDSITSGLGICWQRGRFAQPGCAATGSRPRRSLKRWVGRIGCVNKCKVRSVHEMPDAFDTEEER